ncbi:DgyrCDS11618 [Dimorphilus gyrociliatus]|uniref:GTPase-activating Rap/Ran-GAP domain-like protein 3 n=1 Tax=Dimorphilus gyrociliatus TaxID=2664684 RepID=A0A7I8W4U3_9ANNE|nr:DgyrCDS11618 [Dimorphilus gyrociliatus]
MDRQTRQTNRLQVPAPGLEAIVKESLLFVWPLSSLPSTASANEEEDDDSPASDLAARRGVFSRRHYGSVELLISTDSETNSGRFRIENGERDEGDLSVAAVPSPLTSPVHLENPESQTRWYFKYFLGKLHQNYVGLDSEKEAFFLSVVVTDANNHNVPQYRAILWRKTGNHKICLPYNSSKPMTVKGILSHFDLDKLDKGPKEIYNPDLQKDLLLLEEQEGSVNFKFGIIYAKNGQKSDDEMYSNECGTAEFDKFCSLLGDRIRLKGWEKFRGGLDVKSDTTGVESIYTIYEGHEIMFHVSTFLPHSNENKQQVERKRHVGNDIVNIIFVDSLPDEIPSFKPSMMKTHFTHIFAVVTYNKETESYKLAICSEESVPLFGPALPSPPVFADHRQFRDFLLVKLINGEKAAFNTPVFAQKRERTLDSLIRTLYQEHAPETSKNNMLNRRAFSDIIPDNAHGSNRRKEEARQSEFLKIGQSLKLKTILRGDAPTSTVTSGAILKHQPWEPQSFFENFHYGSIVCGDSWGDKLMVATQSAGVFLLEENVAPRQLFDKSVIVKQLTVSEAHGLLIFRATGKDSRIHAFRLTDFEGESNEEIIRNKSDIKERKLEGSKGSHLYAVSRPGCSHLRMVVCVGKKLLVYAWKHSTAWSAWCSSADVDTVDGFQLLRELSCFETPSLITLVDGGDQGNQICIGYKNQFDLINEKNGDTLQLYQIDSNKSTLICASDIYEDDEAELLLSFNHISHFQKMREECSTQFDFHWNSQPQSIVCAFPYILAFTTDTIEIRLIINGNLVHTMTMPDITLITSKCDIYFASTASTRFTFTEQSQIQQASPPSSPGSYNIYKISLTCLAGQGLHSADKTPPTSAFQPHSMLSPLVDSSSESRKNESKEENLSQCLSLSMS